MLARSYFMVGSFDFKAHLLQLQNNFTTAIFTKICWCKIKVTTLVIQLHSWVTLLICLEQEKLRLRAYVHCCIT
ncbi:hypothetical protein D3C78_1057240 [compost metagenome]